MSKIPFLVRVAVIYICGIIIGLRFSVPVPVFIPLLAVLLILVGFFSIKKYPKFIALVLSVLLMLGSVFYANIFSAVNIPDMGRFKDKFVRLTGAVVSEPDVRSWQTNLIVKADTINLGGSDEVIPVNCKVLVRVGFAKKDIFYGEKYKFSGVLRIPQDKEFSGYLKENKISAVMNVNSRKNIRYIAEAGVNPFIKQSLKLKRILADNLKTYVSPNYFPVLGAMMLKSGMIPGRIRDMFNQIGVVHILSISGLHVAMMSGIFLLLFRLFSIPKRISYGIVFALVILYAVITGLGAPIVRSALMINIFLLGYIIRRRTNIFIALSIAALLILLWNPYELFNAGFQLSFICVLSIVLITPKLEKIFGLKRIWPTEILLVSLAAWLGSLPLVAYYFSYISWISPLSNLLVVPLSTLILACGFLLLMSVWSLPFLPHFLGAAINFLVFLLLKISDVMSSWPFVHSKLPAFNASFVFIYYLALISALFYPEFKNLFKEVRHAK